MKPSKNNINGCKSNILNLRYSTICSFLALLLLASILAPLNASEVTINSNNLEYDQIDKYILAEGSVTVVWQDKILNADKVEFWTEKEYLTAEGGVNFTDGKSTILCEKLAYDYKGHTSEADKATGFMTPWYFAARNMTQKNEKQYNTKNIRMTTCDYRKPHYTIRATSAKILTGKRITVYNPVFFVKNVPVFYLPAFSQPIGGHKYSLEIEPGYNNTDGAIVKVIFGYPLSKNSYGKLYLDYFQKRGWGEGAEYNYNDPDKLQAGIYGYHIKEKTTAQSEYWNFRASHWQRLDAYWTSRSNLNFVNNVTFNSLYMQDNWRLMSQRVDSSLAFTRQTSRSNTQISYNRADVYNTSTGAFEPSTINIPQINYTRFSLLTRSRFNSTLNFNFQNSYNKTGDYYERSGYLKTDIKRSFSFFRRKLSLTPTLAVSEAWSDRDASAVYSNNFTTRYLSSVNMRFYVTRLMSWDLGYSYTLRTKVNSFMVDSDAADYGEELNQIYGQNLFYYGRVNIRNSTSYNLHKNRNEVVEDWREKFAPLVNELTWAPRRSLSLYLKEENNIYLTYKDVLTSDYLRSVQTIATLGNIDEQYVSLGAFYQADRADEMGLNTSFGFWPTKKWKIDYRLSAVALENFNSVRFNDQQVALYRNLHCWEIKVTYRRMLDAEEIYLQLNLTNSSKDRKKLYDQKFEKEFYPWR